MEFQDQDRLYARAQRRVEQIRAFYMHCIVYIAVNLLISSVKIYRNMENGETFSEAFFDFSTVLLWLLWGIGLGLHAFSVFGMNKILGANWEERKIEEFMEDEFKNLEQ